MKKPRRVSLSFEERRCKALIAPVCGPGLEALQQAHVLVGARSAELMVRRSEAGWPVGNAEETRANEAVVLPLAAPRERFWQEVEAGASSLGRCQREERARGVRGALFGAGLGGGVEWRCLPPAPAPPKGSSPCF